MEAPPPTVNLQDDRSGLLIRANMVCAVLAGLAVAGRMVSRMMVKAGFGLSDFLLILGLICSWVIAGLGVWEAKLGMGRHIWVVDPTHYSLMLKIIFADEILYSIVLTSVKISILLLYRGLFPGKLRLSAFTQLLAGLGIFCLCWGISVLFVAIFSCIPIHGFWDLLTMMPPPRCINNKAFYIGLSVPNILADIAILCLPITKVWKLQMSRRSKLAVSGMFLCGGIVVICSIVRFAFLVTVDNSDFTWSYYTIVVWSSAECNLAVLSACVPTMRPVLQKILSTSAFHTILGTTTRFTTRGGKSSDPKHSYNLSKPSQVESEFERLNDSPSRLGDPSFNDVHDGSRAPIAAVYKQGGRPVRKVTPPAQVNKDARYGKAEELLELGRKPLPHITVQKDFTMSDEKQGVYALSICSALSRAEVP